MKRLLIDLEICEKCEECGMLCSYFKHPENNGIRSLMELAHFTVNCRKCVDEPCVAACPWEALEKQKDGVLKRYNMRCTSCKSCSMACPFGTIYPETIPLYVSRCDYCIDRLAEGASPICVESCSPGGIKYGDFEENKEEGYYKVSDNLVIKTSLKWERLEPALVKKK